jgi:enoyl-[acyl-carrier protein] reductase III
MSDFKQKIVLVTGSGRGIGKVIALRFAKAGADVIINFFRNRDPAEQTADEIRQLGRQAIVVKANMGDLDDVKRLYAQIETYFGGLDIMVHNAASGYNRPALAQKQKGWDWTMNINARSLLFGAQQAVPLMAKRNGGAIVALSSLGSIRVLPDYVVVGASKAALEAVVRYLAVELAERNIAVNAVSPGMVLTDALEHFSAYREEAQAIIDLAVTRTPAGRLCMPDDVADLVLYLAGPQARMIRGQTIIMDGGYSLQANF